DEEKLIAAAVLLFSLAAALGIDRALGTTRRAATSLAIAAGGTALTSFLDGLIAAAQAPSLAWRLAAHGALHDSSLAARFLSELRFGLADAAALSLLVALTGLLRRGRPAQDFAILGAAACAASVLASSSGLLHVAPIETVRGPFELAEILKAEAGPSPGHWRLFVNREV